MGNFWKRACCEPVSAEEDDRSPILRNSRTTKELSTTPIIAPDVKTLLDSLEYAAKTYPNAPALGQRPLIKMHEEEKEIVKNINGEEKKEIKKWKFFELGDYDFWTYADLKEKAHKLGAALTTIGLKPKDRLLIFNSTSRDWMLMAQAAFTQNLTIVTAYDTLGPDGLAFALNQGEIEVLFTSAELLPIIESIKDKVKTLKTVIYNSPEQEASPAAIQGFQVVQLSSLMEKDVSVESVRPEPADLACIMYTSGTTGNPKGVMLTHRNLVGVLGGLYPLLKPHLGYPAGQKDICLSYLPLAHVLEFAVECYCIFAGICIGYGSVRTLVDTNMRNCTGDLKALKPTIMAGVPAVWESIRKAVLGKLENAGIAAKTIFHAACKLKWMAVSWGYLGPTPMDLIFSKIKETTGGRLRFTLSGGAPIAKETHQFMTTTVCTMIQGYGLTETCGMCALMLPEHFGTSRVGELVTCGELMLVDVPDAGYKHSNRPNPQGEVWVRGTSVTSGYFKDPKLTKESFTDDGWFKTGDIGEIAPDGSLSLIDRKKNLVKLSNGEYIALEKLESIYKTDALVLNLCVHADPTKDSPTALIVPSAKDIAKLALSLGLKDIPDSATSIDDVSHILENPALVKAVLQQLQKTGKNSGLRGTEIISKVYIVGEEWTSQNGFLTAANKIKRIEIMRKWGDKVQ